MAVQKFLETQCHQSIQCYTYKSSNLEFADPPFVPGDRVVNTGHDEPDPAIGPLEKASVTDVERYCDENGTKQYSYDHSRIRLSI